VPRALNPQETSMASNSLKTVLLYRSLDGRNPRGTPGRSLENQELSRLGKSLSQFLIFQIRFSRIAREIAGCFCMFTGESAVNRHTNR